MGINQKHLSTWQEQSVHAGIGVDTFAFADHLIKVLKMVGGRAPGATNQAINIAFLQQHCSNQGEAAAHFNLGNLNRDAAALHDAVVGLPKIAVTVILFDIDHVVIKLFLEAQPKLFNSLGNDQGTANQGWPCQAFVDHDLAGAQNPLFFAFSIGHAFATGNFCGCKNRLHHGA